MKCALFFVVAVAAAAVAVACFLLFVSFFVCLFCTKMISKRGNLSAKSGRAASHFLAHALMLMYVTERKSDRTFFLLYF